MSRREHILDNAAKVAGGAAGFVAEIGAQAKAAARSAIDAKAQDMDLVPREDYERLEAMLAELRKEHDALKLRVDALEKSASKK